jgi:hypothetical protein
MQRFGFSRWELLALASVLSVGCAVWLPVLAQSGNNDYALQGARAASCMSNVKQIAQALIMYQQDFDDRMPRVTLGKKGMAGGSYGWADVVHPYTKSSSVLQCPAESRAAQDDPMKPGYTDYWLNTNVSGMSYNTAAAPEKLLILGDGDGGSPLSNARYNLNKLPKSWISTPNSPARRHFDTGCYAFHDGHAKRLAPSAVDTPQATFKIK